MIITGEIEGWGGCKICGTGLVVLVIIIGEREREGAREGVRDLHVIASCDILSTYDCTLQVIYTVYNVHNAVYTVHCTLYSVHCTLYSVHCRPKLGTRLVDFK